MVDRIFRVKQGRSIEGVRYDPSSPDVGKRYYRPSSDVRETVIASMIRNGMVEAHHGPDPFTSENPPPASPPSPAARPATPTARMPQSRTASSKNGARASAEPVKTQSRAGKAAQALDEEKVALLNAPPAPYNPVTDQNEPASGEGDDERDDQQDDGEGSDNTPQFPIMSVEASPDHTVPSGTLSPVREPGE